MLIRFTDVFKIKIKNIKKFKKFLATKVILHVFL